MRGLESAPSPAPHEPAPDGPARTPRRPEAAVPFAELHATSSYSFLDGASDPADMVAQAQALGLRALALLDRDGFYGAMKFATAAREYGMPTVYGAELSLDPAPLPVLCRGLDGYRRLSRLMADAHLRGGAKGVVRYPPLADVATALSGHCIVLAGHRWANRLDELVSLFGHDHVVREFEVTMLPEDADHHAQLARWNNLRGIVTARAAAATRRQAGLARAKRSLARRLDVHEADRFIHPAGAPWLRSGEQLTRLAPHLSTAIATTCELAEECAFSLELVAPELPGADVPAGHTDMSWLRTLTNQRGAQRYASRTAQVRRDARRQIDHELGIIEQLNFAGYFLIVSDIVDFCRRENIYCQGRGSAANSAVCFSLGITNVEPVSAGLLFERFLSPEREGPPDIDLDIENGRREAVIQYVYERYGRDNAAQVANVITYRHRGALRDAARALGYPEGADAYPAAVEFLAAELEGQPRHLGIHSGGMVICDRPIADVVPVEWASKADRSVLQWDKEDAAAAGLVKFDLLGLGMLGALHHMVDLVAEHHGRRINLWELDLAEPEVYAMLARADAVGVFQVESRAQLATLPRLRPREFFDLVVEVALIRPGPIQGGSVHPYLRRRNGEEPVTYDHPVLEPALAKTLGIPLFQEQLMQIAVDAAGFTGGEADELRRAMGAKRSPARMAAMRDRFFAGLRDRHGITGEVADTLWSKIVAFAAYGFPESHAQSFASLVYFSAWFKYHYPAEFCVGLLRVQPMGFYSPQSLIQDARRHGVEVLPVDVNVSRRQATIEGGAIRVGLGLVQGLSDATADRIADAAPFSSIPDLSRRAELTVPEMEKLAAAGALRGLAESRRAALWQAGTGERLGMLPGTSAIVAPALPGMNAFELMAADIAATGVTTTGQPLGLLRDALSRAGVLRASELADVPDHTRVRVAGVVTHRQRPQTAGGTVFFGMEDETGLLNVVVSPGLWKRYRRLALHARALIVRGIVENASGAVNIVADRFEELPQGDVLSRGARDFR